MIENLEAIYEATTASAKLVQLLEHRAGLFGTEVEEQKALYFRAATILEDILEEEEQAIGAYRKVLEIEEKNAEAMSALERLLRRNEKWAELVELFEHELMIIEEAEQRYSVRHKLAVIQLEKLEDVAASIEAIRPVLIDEPSHPAARQHAEELLELIADGSGEYELQRRELCDLLEPIFVNEDAHEKLVELLKVRLDDSQDPFDNLELNTRIARLMRDQLQDYEGAFGFFKGAVGAELANSALREEFETLTEVLGDWQSVIELYKEKVELLNDVVAKREVRMRMAQLYEEEQQDSASAIESYCEVIALDEYDREALDALERLYEADQDWPALVKTLRSKANLDFGAERIDLLRKIALLEDEHLGEATQAIATYNEILQQEEGDPDALAALERLYLGEEDWTNLIQIYNERARLAESGEERCSLFYKMAELYEQMLDDPNEAILLYHQALDIAPEDEHALDSLDRLYLQLERNADLADILVRKLERAETDEARNELEYRLGQIYQHHLLGIERAIEFYQNILERDLSNEPAVEALVELLEDEGYRYDASQVLEPIYEAREDWQKLTDLLELQLLDVQDPPAQVDLLVRIATLQQTQLASIDDAFNAWARAMNIEVRDEFQQRLEDLAGITGNYQQLVDVYKAILPNVFEPERLVRLRLRVAECCRDQLDNSAEAELFFLATIEVQEDNAEALDALEKLYSEQAKWDDLLQILERKLQVSAEASARPGGNFPHRCDSRRDAAGCRSCHILLPSSFG